jgi:hypothetical protein
MLEKLKNKMDALAKEAKNIKHILAPDDIKENRLKICNACEHRIQSLNVCNKCGCFLLGKTKLAKSHCPIGKWHSIVLDNKK